MPHLRQARRREPSGDGELQCHFGASDALVSLRTAAIASDFRAAPAISLRFIDFLGIFPDKPMRIDIYTRLLVIIFISHFAGGADGASTAMSKRKYRRMFAFSSFRRAMRG